MYTLTTIFKNHEEKRKTEEVEATKTAEAGVGAAGGKGRAEAGVGAAGGKGRAEADGGNSAQRQERIRLEKEAAEKKRRGELWKNH